MCRSFVVHVVEICEVCVTESSVTAFARGSCRAGRGGPSQPRSVVMSVSQILCCSLYCRTWSDRIAARSCGPNFEILSSNTALVLVEARQERHEDRSVPDVSVE